MVAIKIFGFDGYGIYEGTEFHEDDTFSGLLINKKDAFIIGDYADGENKIRTRYQKRLKGLNLYSFMGMRLTTNQITVGSIVLGHSQKRYFQNEDLDLLKAISKFITPIILRTYQYPINQLFDLKDLKRMQFEEINQLKQTLPKNPGIMNKELKYFNSAVLILLYQNG